MHLKLDAESVIPRPFPPTSLSKHRSQPQVFAAQPSHLCPQNSFLGARVHTPMFQPNRQIATYSSATATNHDLPKTCPFGHEEASNVPRPKHASHQANTCLRWGSRSTSFNED